MGKLGIIDFVRATGTLRAAALGALLVGLYSVIPVLKENTVFHHIADHSSYLYAGIEVLLSLLLVLRSNAAYQRWWEGRTLWGKLVNVSRNLSIKADCLVDAPAAERDELKEDIRTFAAELRNHLRGIRPDPNGHAPGARTRVIYSRVNDWRRRGLVSDDVLRVLDSEMREFMEVCGACERILNTPLSPSYRLFLNQGIALVLLVLPWSLASEIGIWGVPITMLHAYFFIGVQFLASTVEDPFGLEADDLDLDSIVQTIARTV